MTLESILKKASKISFHAGGDCCTTTYCISRYIKDALGIELKTHTGTIQNKRYLTPHVWSSYEGKIIDLASFRQPHERVQALILGKGITPKGNAKRVPAYKVDEYDMQDLFRALSPYAAQNITLVAYHFCTTYKDTGVVPFDALMNIHNEEMEAMYQKFLSYMDESKCA